MLQFLLDHQTMALTILTSFGFGALSHRLGVFLGWLKSPQGKAIGQDVHAALDLAVKTLADSGHPASDDAIQTIKAITAALPEPDAPSGGKAAALVLAFMLAASIGRADVTLPVNGWTAGPSLWAGASLYQADSAGQLVPMQSTLGGVAYSFYTGTWQGDTFTPAYTIGLGLGLRAVGLANDLAVAATGGFYLDGVPITGFTAWDLSAGGGGGVLLGVNTSTVAAFKWVQGLFLGHPGN